MHDSKTFNNVFYALKEDLIYATEFKIQEMVKCKRNRLVICDSRLRIAIWDITGGCSSPEFPPLSRCDRLMPPRMRTRSAGRPAAESLGGGTGVRVRRGGKGKRPREGNVERVDDLNGQGNDQGMGSNGGVEGVNGNVKGANGGSVGNYAFLT
ncbi:hypothetical protein Tco_0146071 [Tanacetum coccineum]